MLSLPSSLVVYSSLGIIYYIGKLRMLTHITMHTSVKDLQLNKSSFHAWSFLRPQNPHPHHRHTRMCLRVLQMRIIGHLPHYMEMGHPARLLQRNLFTVSLIRMKNKDNQVTTINQQQVYPGHSKFLSYHLVPLNLLPQIHIICRQDTVQTLKHSSVSEENRTNNIAEI